MNSQNDEDGIIHEIFRRVGATGRVFVEIGVGDGFENNTAFLASMGWRGYWVDASAECLGALERHHLLRERVKAKIAFVDGGNVGAILGEMGVPREFDFLSVDVDYGTYHVWKGLREYRPRVACIEYNAHAGPSCPWVVPECSRTTWDSSRCYGASLKALELLGDEMGYALVGCDFCGVNSFFVRKDLLGDRFVEPFTSENHYEPPRLFGNVCWPAFHRSWVSAGVATGQFETNAER